MSGSIHINEYLTCASKPHFDKIMSIVRFIKTCFDELDTKDVSHNKIKSIYVFGGFIRDLISHHFDGSDSFEITGDVDVWLKFNHGCISFSRREHMMKILYQQLIENKFNTKIIMRMDGLEPENMEYIAKGFLINGIKFDICANINNRIQFRSLSDFSVNNLYINQDGNVHSRVKTRFTVPQIIKHIKMKYLINITGGEEISTYRMDKVIRKGYAIKEKTEEITDDGWMIHRPRRGKYKR